jgi:hypothetical protein
MCRETTALTLLGEFSYVQIQQLQMLVPAKPCWQHDLFTSHKHAGRQAGNTSVHTHAKKCCILIKRNRSMRSHIMQTQLNRLGKDQASLQRYREAELIHCRWAMLGASGCLAVEVRQGLQQAACKGITQTC